MLYLSPSMKNEINKIKRTLEKDNVSIKLLELLEFSNVDNCIFFKFQQIDNSIDVIDVNSISPQFIDLSGYEASINRFHIDDYVDNNILSQSLLFLEEFKRKWRKIYPSTSCTVLINFQNDKVGTFSTFTFHKNRSNETVFDISDINTISQSILIDVF